MPITAAIGRNVNPVSIGDSDSTCCRYSEPMYHIGRIAALNRKMIPLTIFSGLVNAFGGTSGCLARRSISGKKLSMMKPMISGTSAVDEPHP